MFLVIDLVSLVMGLMLIIVPGKVYNWGKPVHEHKEISPKTKMAFTVFGIVVVIVAALFIYNDLLGG